MTLFHWLPRCILLAALGSLCGCGMVVPKSRVDSLQTRNRALSEQNRAQLAEIDNLKNHSHQTENRLITAEESLAKMDEKAALDREQLANYRRERDQLHEQFMGVVDGRSRVPQAVSARLAEVSKRYPGLQFDPATGIAKLQSDVVFDSGQADLKPGAENLLREIVDVLQTPEARDMKLMVVGHTDDRPVAKKPAREKFPNNFHLSAARALAVTDRLRGLGLQEERLGAAGFGSHQPIAPNVTASNRQKNRRVEIFIMAPDVPVVGWTDSIPSVY